ncbi:hypothetical protein H5410_020985 [Solanum commersonii]|uniref:Uncharacterized protein n=1 Tax=Solanum commersonii TaxID=4109 RepID=A0A9J5ZCX1_SOLCO|nr:hypothetical protein H5410_020985 [Solanum commersonii]
MGPSSSRSTPRLLVVPLASMDSIPTASVDRLVHPTARLILVSFEMQANRSKDSQSLVSGTFVPTLCIQMGPRSSMGPSSSRPTPQWRRRCSSPSS